MSKKATINKRTVFEVKNGAYRPETVKNEIKKLIFNYTGFTDMDRCLNIACVGWRDDSVSLAVPTNCIIHFDVTACIRDADIDRTNFPGMPEIDYSSYYMEDGRKVTKPLKSFLNKLIGKEKTGRIFSEFSNEVAALYSPKYKALASFEDGVHIGHKEWGDYGSCFKKGGCNEGNGDFVALNKRVQVLVIDDQKGNKARCLCYFKGGREIFLTNFYYNGIINNKLLFVEAFRYLMNLDKLSFKVGGEGNDLNIYLNSDGVRIDANKRDYGRDTVFVCPVCGDDYRKSNEETEVKGNTYHIGCSYTCIENSIEKYSDFICDRCGEGGTEDEGFLIGDDERWCSGCGESHAMWCEGCDTYHDTNCVNMECIDGTYLCEDHYVKCEDCDTALDRDDGCYSITENGDILCENCANYCEECDTTRYSNEMQNLENGDYVCDDCAHTCDDCGGRFLDSDLDTDNLCDTCAEEKEERETEEEEEVAA